MRITMPGEKRGAMRREPFGRPQADCAGGAGVGESGGFGATPRSPTRRCRAGSGRSAAARFALAVLLLATSGTARAQYEVDQWSADMTAGSTTLPGAIEFQGYDEDEAEGSGSLSGAEFAFHDGTTYRVSRVGTTAAQFVLRLRPPLGSSVRRDLVELEFGDTTYAFADATHTTVGTGADEASEFVWPRATAAGALANEASRFGWPGATAGTRTNGASQFVSAASTESNGRDRVRVSLVAQGTLPPLQAHEEVRLRTTMTVRYDWCHTDQLIGLPGCFYRGFHDRDSVGSMRRTYFRFDNMETDAGVQLVGVHRPSEHSGTRTLMLEVYVGFMISDEESDAADGTYTSFANALKNDGRWNLYLGNQKYAVHDADFYGYIPGTNGDSAGPARRYTWTDSSYTMPNLSPSGRRVQVLLTRRPISSAQIAAEPLTVEFRGLPGTHNGAPFSFEAAFSDTVSATPAHLRDAFTATGATVTGAALKDDGGGVYDGDKVWIVDVAPSGTGRVSLLLGPWADCADANAVCTGDGRPLSTGMATQVAFAPWLSVADAAATEEENATMDFDVTLAPAVDETVTVDYATSDGTATAPADYAATSGTLTFAANETAKTVSVPVVDDNVPDNNESFTLTLSNPTVAAIADAEATGTISNTETDTDVELTASFDDVPASHDGPGNIFVLGLAFSEDVAGLGYATLRDAFVVEGGEVVGAQRETEGGNRNWRIKVEPAGEATVTVTLAAGAVETGGGRTLSAGISATVPPSALTARWSGVPIVGHDGARAFGIDIKFNWSVDVTAKAMRDEVLTVTGGTVKQAKWAHGASAGWWRIRIEPSSHRDVKVELPATASCADAGAVCTAAGRALADGLEPVVVWGPRALSVSDATATEGEGATLDFELTMNRVPYEALTVTYETRDGTATAGSDYTATSGTLTIGEDETRKKVSVPVLDDDAAEDGETMTFVVTRLEGAHSLLLDGEGEGTITDDDKAARPMLSVSDASGTEGGTASFEVTLDPAPAGPVTTYYATADGTARSGSDYTGRWGTLAFAAGETSKTVAVELLDDELAEPDETFSLELITATGAGYGDPSGTGTIGDDDAAAAPTAAFDDGTLPAEHDGSTAFTVDLAFSEEIADIGYAWVRDTLVTATNGTVENARRADPPSNLAWELEVEPDGSADVTLTVAERLSLPDGRTLAGGDTATVGAQPAPTAAFDDETLPAEHDGSTAFTVDLAFSEEIADIGYAWVRDTLVTATDGTVGNARRVDPPSNLVWELEVEPDSAADVTLTVEEGLSLPDGRTLAGGDAATVPGPAPQGASANGAVVTLTWASPRDGFGRPSRTDYAVAVNGVPRRVASAQIVGHRAVLVLSMPVVPGDAVRVGYVGSAMHPLADATGRLRSAPWYGLAAENVTGADGAATATALLRPVRPADPVAAAGEDTVALDASGLGLTDISALARLTALERLDLSGNAVADLSPLAGLAGLRDLDLSGNRVADLGALAALDRLERLDLSDNRVADAWPLADLPNLTVLLLDGNAVADPWPVAHLARLENLGFAGNRVVDVTALQDLPVLRRLDLGGNPVRDLSPLGDIGALAWLALPGGDSRVPVTSATRQGITAPRRVWPTP